MSAAAERTALWAYDDSGHDVIATRSLGFWLYLISDALLFAALFAAYGVYAHNYAGGPTADAVVRPVHAFWETLVVFASVLAYGFAMSALKHGRRAGVAAWLLAAGALGALFLVMEAHDFGALAAIGAVPQRSGFLSAYWTIILTHAAHMLVGLLWMLVALVQVLRIGFTEDVVSRLLNLKLFWHFQAVIWVCVYSFVILKGIA